MNYRRGFRLRPGDPLPESWRTSTGNLTFRRRHEYPERREPAQPLVVVAEDVSLVQSSTPASPPSEAGQSSAKATGSASQAPDAAGPSRGQGQEPVLKLSRLPHPDTMISLLVCVSCGTFPGPVFHKCRSGHLVCHSCATTLPSCSFRHVSTGWRCGSYFSRFNLYVFSYIFNNSRVHCPWDGCLETPKGRELDCHKQNCLFRPCVDCPFSLCPKKNCTNLDYVEHVINFHNVAVTDSPAYGITKSFKDLGDTSGDAHRFVGAVFRVFGLEFAFILQADETELKIWMSSMSSKEAIGSRCFNWSCNVQSKTKKHRIQYHGAVHERERSTASILDEDECFSVSKANLKKIFCFPGEDGEEHFRADITITEAESSFPDGQPTKDVEQMDKEVAPQDFVEPVKEEVFQKLSNELRDGLADSLVLSDREANASYSATSEKSSASSFTTATKVGQPADAEGSSENANLEAPECKSLPANEDTGPSELSTTVVEVEVSQPKSAEDGEPAFTNKQRKEAESPLLLPESGTMEEKENEKTAEGFEAGLPKAAEILLPFCLSSAGTRSTFADCLVPATTVHSDEDDDEVFKLPNAEPKELQLCHNQPESPDQEIQPNGIQQAQSLEVEKEPPQNESEKVKSPEAPEASGTNQEEAPPSSSPACSTTTRKLEASEDLKEKARMLKSLRSLSERAAQSFAMIAEFGPYGDIARCRSSLLATSIPDDEKPTEMKKRKFKELVRVKIPGTTAEIQQDEAHVLLADQLQLSDQSMQPPGSEEMKSKESEPATHEKCASPEPQQLQAAQFAQLIAKLTSPAPAQMELIPTPSTVSDSSSHRPTTALVRTEGGTGVPSDDTVEPSKSQVDPANPVNQPMPESRDDHPLAPMTMAPETKETSPMPPTCKPESNTLTGEEAPQN